MVIKTIGLKIPPQTILYVKFTIGKNEQFKCTSTNFYKYDAAKFAKNKDVIVTMEVISYHGKEHTPTKNNYETKIGNTLYGK